MTKEFPNAFETGDREVLVDPIRVNLGGFKVTHVDPILEAFKVLWRKW
jgi:putative transposase